MNGPAIAAAPATGLPPAPPGPGAGRGPPVCSPSREWWGCGGEGAGAPMAPLRRGDHGAMTDSQSVMTGVRDAELDSGHWVRVRLQLGFGCANQVLNKWI